MNFVKQTLLLLLPLVIVVTDSVDVFGVGADLLSVSLDLDPVIAEGTVMGNVRSRYRSIHRSGGRSGNGRSRSRSSHRNVMPVYYKVIALQR